MHLPIEGVLLGVAHFDQHVRIAVQNDENEDCILKDGRVVLAILLAGGIDWATAIPLTSDLHIGVHGCTGHLDQFGRPVSTWATVYMPSPKLLLTCGEWVHWKSYRALYW